MEVGHYIPWTNSREVGIDRAEISTKEGATKGVEGINIYNGVGGASLKRRERERFIIGR